MQNAYIRMVLDVRERNTPNVVVVKKNDTARTLRIHLVDGNAAYTIGPECTAVMTALKADGTKLFNSCTVEENVVVYPFTEQTCSCAGRMICEVRVIGSNGKMLTSASFTMVVQETAYSDGDTVSQGEADALALLVGQTTALRDELNRKLENGEFVGPQGPAGQEGKQGPTGPRGEAGPAGPRGAQGPAGPKGADGTVSFEQLTPQQIESLRGPVGPRGADGLPGKDGAVGPAGPSGKDGAAGPTGPVGPQGPAGNTGPAGATGPAGKSAYQIAVDGGFVGNEEAWLVSLVGPRGPQGERGATGQQGAQGPAGKDGAAGAQGPQGPQGVPGKDGAPGAQGLQGPPGKDGAVGPAGPSGKDGAAGPIGPVGPQGPAGKDGSVITWQSATLGLSWSGSRPYTQTVSVPGIPAEAKAVTVWPEWSADAAVRAKQREAWNLVSRIVPAAGSVAFTCDEDKPVAEVPMRIEVQL